MEGAKDKANPNIDYASLVSALKARGVKFEVCEITLKNRNLTKNQFILDAEFTPSGVARIGQLQSREKFAYIKP
jgi:intracellular sulfur oxidation DsrE/DsrF family protein